MPRTKSAAKRARQAIVRHGRLLPYKSRMKTMIRKMTDLVKEGKKTEAAALLPEVYKAIDVAAKKQIVHKNTADRRKSSMGKMLAA